MTDDWIAAFAEKIVTAGLVERNILLASEEGLQFVETVYVEHLVAAYDGDLDDALYPSALSPVAAFAVMNALLTNPHLRTKIEVAFFEIEALLLAKEPPRDSHARKPWEQSLRDLMKRHGYANTGKPGRPPKVTRPPKP